MAIPKRNSQKILVNGQYFRWSPTKDSGLIRLIAQHLSGLGKTLEVEILNNKITVAENEKYTLSLNASNKLVITPTFVQEIILDAIKLGWKPLDRGNPIELTFVKGKLEVRSGI